MDNQIQKVISHAEKNKQIIAIALFGSSLNSKGRDIDICIFLDKKYSNLEMSKIRLEFLKRVSNKFDIQIFQQLPIYIRARIIKKHKILLCKNSDLLYETAFNTTKEFGFFKKIYDNYLNSIKNG